MINGKCLHVQFIPLTRGGSYYETNNPNVIDALKARSVYGIDYTVEESVVKEVKTETHPTLEDVKFSNLADAALFAKEKGLEVKKSKASITEALKGIGFNLIIE